VCFERYNNLQDNVPRIRTQERWPLDHQKLHPVNCRHPDVHVILASALPLAVRNRNKIGYKLKTYKDGKIINLQSK
jgi:hypothetical protein